MSDDLAAPSITEEEIAQFLVQTPEFFERHADVLANIQLANRNGRRAISLQERQLHTLRERVQTLDARLADMIRYGKENFGHYEKLHRLACDMMKSRDISRLPNILCSRLQDLFSIPAVGLQLWDVAPAYADLPCASGVSADTRHLASSLNQPYCGPSAGFDANVWLARAAAPSAATNSSDSNPDRAITSVAMMALRNAEAQAFGFLVLGSPDPERYSADMNTDILKQLSEMAGCALSRLQG